MILRSLTLKSPGFLPGGPPERHRVLTPYSWFDTNDCMNLNTRDRLIAAASQLFADAGYVGASVREICNLARANPGAVSYHFGGKRQLYRAVLRQAAERLAWVREQAEETEHEPPPELGDVIHAIFRRLDEDRVATRLLMRDLVDGGTLAVEALEPTLRSALEELRARVDAPDTPRPSPELSTLFLELAAPVVLLVLAWPVLARPLEMNDSDRSRILQTMIGRVVGS